MFQKQKHAPIQRNKIRKKEHPQILRKYKRLLQHREKNYSTSNDSLPCILHKIFQKCQMSKTTTAVVEQDGSEALGTCSHPRPNTYF